MSTLLWIVAAVVLAAAALVLLWARRADAHRHEQRRVQELLGDGDMAPWRDAAGEW